MYRLGYAKIRQIYKFLCFTLDVNVEVDVKECEN